MCRIFIVQGNGARGHSTILHQQHGTAEWVNRTIVELARAMLIHRDLPVFLWEEAVSHVAYLRNRAQTRALQGKTPYAMWTGRKPDVSHLREFGSAVWVLLEGQPDKLQPKAAKFVLTGYNDDSSSIRFYDARTRWIQSSWNF